MNGEIRGTFSTEEITKWSERYNETVSNAPKLIFSKAEEAIVNNRYYIRIPLKNSKGMVYFTKTNSLQAVFIRTNILSGEVSNARTQNMEFIDLNNFKYQVITYKNKRPDSIYTAIPKNQNSTNNKQPVPTVRTFSSGGGTFWFDLGCVLSLGIPRWGDSGERECWGINLWSWVAGLLSGATDTSGQPADLGGFWIGDSGIMTGYIGQSNSGGPYSIFAWNPSTTATSWKNVVNDFYSETDIDDLENSNGIGEMNVIPHSITLNNGQVITVEFGMTLDFNTADHMVSQRLIDALVGTLNACSGSLLGINSIYIKATTNGTHGPNSNHSRGTALDISRINGIPIIYFNEGAGNDQTLSLQMQFENQPFRRENFGPNLKHKLGLPFNVGGHTDHIHFSVDGY